MSLEEFKYFLIGLEKKESTIERYLWAIRHLQELLSRLFGVDDFAEVPPKRLLVLLGMLKDKMGWEKTTFYTYVSALRVYLEFTGLTEHVAALRKIKAPPEPEERPDLTREEVRRLVRAAEELGERNLADLLRVLWQTGMRVSEALSITRDSLVREGGRCFIVVAHTKSGRARKVPVSEDLFSRLQEWCRIHRGRAFPRSYKTYYRLLKQAGRKAGIPGRKLYFHALRARFIKDAYSYTKNLKLVQAAVGHANIKTTARYIRVEEGEIEALYKKKIEEKI